MWDKKRKTKGREKKKRYTDRFKKYMGKGGRKRQQERGKKRRLLLTMARKRQRGY